MKKLIGSFAALSMLVSVCVVLGFAGTANLDDHTLNVHNATGHEVVVFVFQDDHVHLNEVGGTQLEHLHDGESAVAHVPNCKLAVVLVDHDDIWHAEFHDCHATDMTFTKTTGHEHRQAPQ